MSYKLEKPYTEKQKADFIVEYNHNKNLRIEATNLCLYALEDNEILENGIPIENPEYISEQKKLFKEEEKKKLQLQLDELDKKRIRAICEPSMKTETQSWLEYYNQQVLDLRQMLAKI